MTRLEEIEKDIRQLSSAELAAFRSWFYEFDADEWDREIEQDIKAGKLDALAQEALAEHKAGKTREI
ncbi:MAG: hypothetical protein AB1656_24060 [Candidatus Omnitrophota bacterium]